ncbi:MAG: hypothetical protein STSR0001_26490 [Methanothrix sp.]
MEVPDFQSFILPLLKFSADGMEHNQRGAKDALSPGFLEMAIRSSASFTRDHGCRPSGDETRYLWRALKPNLPDQIGA